MKSTTGNHLLDSLSMQDYDRVARYLKPVRLRRGDFLCRAGGLIHFGFFCTGATVSTVGTCADGQIIEGVLAGREGMVGLPIVLSDAVMPHGAIVQTDGSALCIPASALRDTFNTSDTLREAILRTTQYYLTQATQTAVCNRSHTLDARLARWMLMARDATGSNELGLTHETLAQMLGVHRPGVSLVISAMRGMGVLECARGHIHILKPGRLREMSCGCYLVVRSERDRLLGITRPEPLVAR